MVNILVFESEKDDKVLNEVIDFLSDRTQYQITNLSSCNDMLSFPGLKICPREQMVYRNNKRVFMVYHEFFTLLYLAQHPGWVFSKEQIYNAVYEDDFLESIDNSIYCLIRSLRKKLETDPRHPKYIQTVRGVGYKFVVPEE